MNSVEMGEPLMDDVVDEVDSDGAMTNTDSESEVCFVYV